jgi:hypothetical protein
VITLAIDPARKADSLANMGFGKLAACV